jgi:DNA-binding protein YbaB
MFNPLKSIGELKKLRDQAQALQKELQKIEIVEQKGRAEVVLSADMKIKSVKMNGEELNDLREALNSAIDKAQKKAAEKMQAMGGGLLGMLK